MALWSTAKTQSKQGFDKVYTWVDKLGAPVNRLSNKVGSEAFWPTTLDIESDKAARILKSFCSTSTSAASRQVLTRPQRMDSTRKKTDPSPPTSPRENNESSRRYPPRSSRMPKAYAYSPPCGPAFGSPDLAEPAYWSHARPMEHGHPRQAS